MLPLAILGPIERALTAVLEWLHASAGLTWGLAIVALTLMVRLVILPLTIKQIRSTQKLQVVAPQLKAIQQKYKNDKKRQQEEIMAFYRENKVNPASSCLPILLQIPIFIALFFVLRDFEKEVFPEYPNSELGFLGVVPSITADINSHWTGYLLLVLYVGSQLLSTFLMAAAMDRTQKTIFMVLPFAFVPFILTFPTGLLIYWVTTNLWTVGQGLITRRLMPKPPAPPPKRTSRAQPEPAAKPAGDGAQPETAVKTPAGQQQRRVRRRKKRGPQARR